MFNTVLSHSVEICFKQVMLKYEMDYSNKNGVQFKMHYLSCTKHGPMLKQPRLIILGHFKCRCSVHGCLLFISKQIRVIPATRAHEGLALQLSGFATSPCLPKFWVLTTPIRLAGDGLGFLLRVAILRKFFKRGVVLVSAQNQGILFIRYAFASPL